MVDVQDVGLAAVVTVGVAVHTDDDRLAAGDGSLRAIRSVCDLILEPALFNGGVDAGEDVAATEGAEVREDRLCFGVEPIGEGFDEPGSTEGIGHVGNPGLLRDDLLGA